MQKLSMLELDMVSGGAYNVVVTAPGHYVADHGHIDASGCDIVTHYVDHGNITTGDLFDYCN